MESNKPEFQILSDQQNIHRTDDQQKAAQYNGPTIFTHQFNEGHCLHGFYPFLVDCLKSRRSLLDTVGTVTR